MSLSRKTQSRFCKELEAGESLCFKAFVLSGDISVLEKRRQSIGNVQA